MVNNRAATVFFYKVCRMYIIGHAEQK